MASGGWDTLSTGSPQQPGVGLSVEDSAEHTGEDDELLVSRSLVTPPRYPEEDRMEGLMV